jgi:hypothetical protein
MAFAARGADKMLSRRTRQRKQAMSIDRDDAHIADPNAGLERALIEEFIRTRGYDPAKLHDLPEELRRRVQSDASTHAAARLAEMEARAHYVHELHGDK